MFALANQHLRWELNDLARRLDEKTAAVGLPEEVSVRERLGVPIKTVQRHLNRGLLILLEKLGDLKPSG